MKTYSFEKLQVWQQARVLTKNIYLITKKFPSDEKFGLTSQLRRASVSVCSNLAEGSSRNSYKDKARFTEIAYGSLMEILNQLILSVDLALINQREYEQLRINIEEIGNMLNGLRKVNLTTLANNPKTLNLINSTMKKIRLGISVGDINGIGMEVIIKTFKDSRMLDMCIPIVYGSSKVSTFHRKALHINDFSFNIIKSAKEANVKKPNIIDCWKEDVEINLGQSTEAGGKYALASLEAATEDLKNGEIDVLVTAPINKDNIQSETFNFPGHTEYLTDKFEGNSLMLMVNDNIKIGVATNHIPLSKVANTLTSDTIFGKLKILNKALVQDFCITSPRIAVLGLNPHAGDNGLIGKEEEAVIIPAIDNAKSIGINTFGPYPADGFFGSGNYQKFDAILAMYHDQGLIPFKSLSFGEGTNFTAGLDIVRTSPDHGVAYEIAGKNKAEESSFRQAVYTACDIYRNREFAAEINENPLPPAKK